MEERYKTDAAFFAAMCHNDEETAVETGSFGDQTTGTVKWGSDIYCHEAFF